MMTTSEQSETHAPVAAQKLHTWSRVTGDVHDPWAWLSDRENPETIAYLKAENEYAAKWYQPHQPLLEEIFDQIKSRMVEDDTSVPVCNGRWWYIRQTIAGSGYTIHRRGPTKDLAGQNLLLDENLEAKSFEYFELGAFELSHQQNLLAWSFQTDGSERFTIRIRDLDTGVDLDDIVTDTSNASLAWSHDAKHIFYITHDDAMRPDKVWRHTLGQSQSSDSVVYHETDERFNVGICLTRSGEWIVIESASRVTTECHLLASTNVIAPLTIVRHRDAEIEYHIDHWGDCFVVLTNLDAVDFRVMTAPLSQPNVWKELVAHTAGKRIANIDVFKNHLILHQWIDAQQTLRVLRHDGTSSALTTGDHPHEIGSQYCPQWDTQTYRYSQESLITPTTVFDHDLESDQRISVKTQLVPNADLSNYVTTREWAIASDNSLIPIDIVRHKDTPINNSAPGLLYAYGSYEASVPPWFSVARLSLLDRGWIWALAHPRGGGECGRQWYLDGKLLNKKNTFSDVNACARHLYKKHVAVGDLAVRGGSAGGLMVGACVTSEPSLYGAAIAEVPFVDVINSMSDPTLPLTINEWEEWGDPRTEPAASYMLSYSPYDNTNSDAYPPMLVTAGLNDVRVCYHEPAKWVAKLRAIGKIRQPLIFECEMDAGHHGKSDRYDQWRDEAKVLVFLLAR